MPTYDYKCNACSHTFEHFQSMKDKPLKKCPECGKNSLERLIGIGAAVLFKGSGFYQTDYRSEGYKKAADADKPAEAKPESKPEPKPDTKPAEAMKPASPANNPAPSSTNGKETAKAAPKAAKPESAKPNAGKRERN